MFLLVKLDLFSWQLGISSNFQKILCANFLWIDLWIFDGLISNFCCIWCIDSLYANKRGLLLLPAWTAQSYCRIGDLFTAQRRRRWTTSCVLAAVWYVAGKADRTGKHSGRAVDIAIQKHNEKHLKSGPLPLLKLKYYCAVFCLGANECFTIRSSEIFYTVIIVLQLWLICKSSWIPYVQ